MQFIRALILFIQTLALYKSFTYLLTYLRIFKCPQIGPTLKSDITFSCLQRF